MVSGRGGKEKVLIFFIGITLGFFSVAPPDSQIINDHQGDRTVHDGTKGVLRGKKRNGSGIDQMSKLQIGSHDRVTIKKVRDNPGLTSGQKKHKNDPGKFSLGQRHVSQVKAKGIRDIIEKKKNVNQFADGVTAVIGEIHPHPVRKLESGVKNCKIKKSGKKKAMPERWHREDRTPPRILAGKRSKQNAKKNQNGKIN